jgi:4-azaleucine resistance transporter AzlC
MRTGKLASGAEMGAGNGFAQGVRAGLPLLVSIVPFGAITGVAAVSLGFSPELSVAMGILIFAGASQLAAMQLMASGATALAIVATAAMINLRFLLYSASLRAHFNEVSAPRRLLLAYLLTDPAYAFAITRFRDADLPQRFKFWYYFGLAALIWLIWVGATIAGSYLGTRIPANWSLDFTIALNFIAVLVPTITDRATVVAALVAGIVGVLAANAPFNLGLIIAALCAIAAGMLVETGQRRWNREPGNE